MRGMNQAKGPVHTSYAEGIWKWRFHSENASNAFHPQYAREIQKHNNHQSFRICVWKKNWAGKPHDDSKVIVLKKPRCQNSFRT